MSERVLYAASADTDLKKLHAVYSLVNEILKNRNDVAATAKTDVERYMHTGKFYNYNKKATKNLKQLLYEQNTLKDKIIAANYSDEEWKELSVDEQLVIERNLFGDKLVEREKPTTSTSPLLDNVRSLKLDGMDEVELVDPTENLLQYIEVDTGGDFSITANQITVSTMDKNYKAYVYKDFGPGFFNGDFYHKFIFNMTASSGSYVELPLWGMKNIIGDMSDLRSQSENGYTFETDWNIPVAINQLRLYRTSSGSESADSYTTAQPLNTEYYVEIERDESIGTYGAIYCYFCRDDYYSEGGTPDDTLSRSEVAKIDFRYFYVAQTNYYNQTARDASGYGNSYDLGWTAPAPNSFSVRPAGTECQYRMSIPLRKTTVNTGYPTLFTVLKSGAPSSQQAICLAEVEDDFRDIVFAKGDGTTIVPHWKDLGYYSEGEYVDVWVNLHKAGHSSLTSDSGTGTVIVSDGSKFEEGDYIVVADDTNPQGEVVRIIGISTNTLTVTPSLSNTYTTAENAVASHMIYVYYGDPAMTDQSNGDDTWEFFDDFEDGTTDKWSVYNTEYGSFDVDAAYAKAGNYGLRIYDTSTGGTPYMRALGMAAEGKRVKFWHKPMHETNENYLFWYNSLDGDRCYLFQYFGQYAYYTTGVNYLYNYTAGNWYHIEILARSGNATWQFFMNKIQYGGTIAMYAGSSSSDYLHFGYNTTQTNYYDYYDSVCIGKFDYGDEPYAGVYGYEQSYVPSGAANKINRISVTSIKKMSKVNRANILKFNKISV